jgi:HJR/Mrr/RecB family endonuclease
LEYLIKFAKNTHDHAIFALVILLAAAVYAHQAKGHIRQQRIVEIISVAVGIIGLVIFLKVLQKLIVRRATQHFPQSLIDSMSGTEFELYVAQLLPSQGYKHIELTEHYDFGFDILAEKEGVTWGIQVKRHSSPVKIEAVRQAVAALKHYDCDKAMVITNNSFSGPARELAVSNNCVLIDRQQLMRWTSPGLLPR